MFLHVTKKSLVKFYLLYLFILQCVAGRGRTAVERERDTRRRGTGGGRV